MVTGETLQKELGTLRSEIQKIPFETIKWLFLLAGTIAAIVFGTYQMFLKH